MSDPVTRHRVGDLVRVGNGTAAVMAGAVVAAITDANTGLPVTPSGGVVFRFLRPDGSELVAPATVQEAGRFYADVTPDMAGTWYVYGVYGSPSVKVLMDTFRVLPGP